MATDEESEIAFGDTIAVELACAVATIYGTSQSSAYLEEAVQRLYLPSCRLSNRFRASLGISILTKDDQIQKVK